MVKKRETLGSITSDPLLYPHWFVELAEQKGQEANVAKQLLQLKQLSDTVRLAVLAATAATPDAFGERVDVVRHFIKMVLDGTNPLEALADLHQKVKGAPPARGPREGAEPTGEVRKTFEKRTRE